MRVTLISPRLALQKGDFLGSGVPYWPVELAVLAAHLRQAGEDVAVYDLFGSAPRRLETRDDHYLQGVNVAAVDIPPSDLVVLFAISAMSHGEVLDIARHLRARHQTTPLLVLENSQAVTGYAVDERADEFFGVGVDALLCGYPFGNLTEVVAAMVAGAPPPSNLMVSSPPAGWHLERSCVVAPTTLAPAWDLFPIHNYWSLPYSHGPKTPRYFPLLTSSGCPFRCDFCVAPRTGRRAWLPRHATEVVSEMMALERRFGVADFQIEDLNPTIDADRWRRIADLLLARNAHQRFYFASGTHAGSIPLDLVPLLARAGCRYISISPESGSPALLRHIGKSFDHEHALALVRACRAHGVATQACFLVGHPGEGAGDHALSRSYLRALVRSGLDEVAVFVVSPLPGSALHSRGAIPLESGDRLMSFSPRGRVDWRHARGRRRDLAAVFLRAKAVPGRGLWTQALRALWGAPRTKAENLPRRVVFTYAMIARHHLARFRFGGRCNRGDGRS